MIHNTAIINATAEIGYGVNIWANCNIMSYAIIGDRCNIGQNVIIGESVYVGRGCKIQDNSSIYSGVVLDEKVFIGPSVVVTNVINPRAFISKMSEKRMTLVRKGATIGANSTIVCDVIIGKYAMVGAGSVVTKDVPDYALVVGNPARKIGEVNEAGNRTDRKPD